MNPPPVALSAFDRDILAVLALLDREVSQREWAGVLQATGVLTKAASRTSALNEAVQRLAAEGVIVATGRYREAHYIIHAGLLFTLLEDAEERGRLTILHFEVQRAQGYASTDPPWRYSYGLDLLNRYGTELRVCLVVGAKKGAREALEKVAGALGSSKAARAEFADWLMDVVGPAPTASRLDALGEYEETYLERLYHWAVSQLWPLDSVLLERELTGQGARLEAARYLAMRGQGDAANALGVKKTRQQIALLGAFFEGDHAAVVALGKAGIAEMPKNRKYRQFRDLEGLCHALSRVAMSQQEPGEWDALGVAANNAKSANAGFSPAYEVLRAFHKSARAGRRLDKTMLMHQSGYYPQSGAFVPWPTILAVGLVLVWARCRADWVVEPIRRSASSAHRGGFQWIAREFDAILSALTDETPSVPSDTLAGAYQPREPWEISLDTLERLAASKRESPEAPTAPAERHLVWEVSFDEHEVRIAARVAGGRAKKGKEVSLSRLLEGKESAISERDRHVLTLVDFVQTYTRRQKQPVLGLRALLGLVGHPYVIRRGGMALTITRGEPGLFVESKGDDLLVTLEPRSLAQRPIVFEEQSPTHVVVFERTPEIDGLTNALGADGSLLLPGRARDRLAKVLAGLGSTLKVSASADIAVAGEERPPDSRAVIALRWDGSSLYARFQVAPLGLQGPLVGPAEGARTLAASIDGKSLHTTRDFDAERISVDSVLDHCPLFAALPSLHGESCATDLMQALEVLLEFEAIGDSVLLAWPRGTRLKVPTTRGLQQLKVQVREASDWLTVDAQLTIDEDQVLGFRELMSQRRGRFVEIGDSRFVALTVELQRRLDALEGLGKIQKKGLVTSPVVLPLVADLLRGAAKVTFDAKAKRRQEKVAQAAKLKPRVPRAFEAELRDYQREGFVWLARLAEAGLGACLADDMGLGKTIQTLALLVARAKHGPALVVAPTSVASNWIDEAARFAPGLRCISLADGDRAKAVEGLGPRSVLVCSYGLLVTEAERLGGVSFDTVVFDEAHMLKNARTKRAKAAHGLQAEFRLSLTGTPLENHLGELYSLMQATVPGLLGSEKHFQVRFEGPIREGDRERSRQLRALLRPFLLRRTKAEVLDELPPRTEVTIRIEPTAEERAYYEALRRHALEELEQADEEGSAGAKGRLQVLAQIGRLRQAAVDPQLLDPGAPRGAKIDALIERVLALRDEGHRALVFSQFLGGMERVRVGLQEAGVTFLSLDGSTPAKERTRLIAAFQEGDTDVFVMSLKAGGVGVNLTGADYVIHLDPWWNPAVEDQATGRAHRIGQERPVTVYRLVTVGTIEEKILALHREKRDLAEDLLDNMNRAKKLDVEELRALL